MHHGYGISYLLLSLFSLNRCHCYYFPFHAYLLVNSRLMYRVQDVHERFRTESHSEAAGRFNERFLLSIASCKSCVVMDDELNILPISSHIKSIMPVPAKEVSFIIVLY